MHVSRSRMIRNLASLLEVRSGFIIKPTHTYNANQKWPHNISSPLSLNWPRRKIGPSELKGFSPHTIFKQKDIRQYRRLYSTTRQYRHPHNEHNEKLLGHRLCHFGVVCNSSPCSNSWAKGLRRLSGTIGDIYHTNGTISNTIGTIYNTIGSINDNICTIWKTILNTKTTTIPITICASVGARISSGVCCKRKFVSKRTYR